MRRAIEDERARLARLDADRARAAAKAEVLAVAEETGLLPTTVEKDYALGWVLFAIADHPGVSQWYFKGGTCLKKCFFDTYRFSEDLDFTIPPGVPYEVEAIRGALLELGEWVRDR